MTDASSLAYRENDLDSTGSGKRKNKIKHNADDTDFRPSSGEDSFGSSEHDSMSRPSSDLTLGPSDSVSRRAAPSTTESLSVLAADFPAFREYLDAASCHYELDTTPSPQNPISDNISDILGKLPDLPGVYDFSVSGVRQVLETCIDIRLNPQFGKNSTISQMAQKLHQEWELKPEDWEKQHQCLERAILVKALSLWDKTYLACLKAVFATPSPLPPASSNIGMLLAERLLIQYGHHDWQEGMKEPSFRFGSNVPNNVGLFHERHTKLVFARVDQLGGYCEADQFLVSPLQLGTRLNKPDCMLLHWGLSEILDKREDGSLKFAVQKVEEWGRPEEFPNYLRYLDFLTKHRAWFENTVWDLIQKRKSENHSWVIHKLRRQKFKQWSMEYVSCT
ncbi:hypothetical protein K435DRAFT_804791 [Dendrothele bispora CBS 962.96]|uniref:Uncharacterized protein n=1 Tax=Dendrothele bispora (strain CBS 962.96) TaxID=1314807 RepID=A0A4S8LDW9_DENBC|nr:hypothetical protein K435DRAFT_804791 [Dendrothele bispora CBS 962.96]